MSKKDKSPSIQYTREFFDREYSAAEVYGRLWRYARRYRLRIVLGIVCGILTAGTLLPLYQVIQPSLSGIMANEQHARVDQVEVKVDKSEVAAPVITPAHAKAEKKHLSKFEKEMAKASELPSWYPKVEKLAAKCGIKLQNEAGEMGAALVLLVVVVVPLIAFVRLGLVFLNHYCLAWAAMKVVADLRVDILEHLQKQSLQFFGRIDVGQLMSRSTSDPQQMRQILQHVLQELAQAPFEIAVSVGYIIWFALANKMLPTLAIICIGFPLFIVPVVALSKRIRKWAKRALKRFSVVGSRIHEILTCVRVVRAYDTAEYENAKYRKVVHDLLKATLRTIRLGLLVGPAVETVGILLICGFVVWCFFAHVTMSTVLPMLAPLLIIYKPLKQLSKIQVQIEQGRAALARIFSILDVQMELPERADAQAKPSFDRAITFEDVSFRYDTADHDAVSHATFELPRGGFVAVVGGTGSGKSTMSGLLARFYDPREGSVKMDGIDLRDVRQSDLRKLVGAVMQETLLFNDTIEENIKYGSPNATHEEVEAAAKLANAHDFIMSQPEGYARVVGEKGFALSGGERQRIAIARAILRNPPILILDEATSALDTVTERLVQNAIDNLMKDRTTFAIAHRLSTIRNADLILVMQDGRIVERGTHDELFSANGVYRRLCEMQKTS
ncbi:MAG: ABC transporter ATP-binding protein/permease [Kiritimatiellae bacterium]|nr:ABC transporter ATP-binding protein/permease [Kiritimatiellia bacterium]